jgi:hypothetical protein
MPNRCRLCTSNDREALIDEMAAHAWVCAGYGEDWGKAPETWRSGFRHHADLMLRALEREYAPSHG